MERQGRSRVRWVEDAGAIRFLADPSESRLLTPFLTEECRLGDVARTLSLRLSTLHYRVRRLEAWGLLEVARVEPRKGRAVKLYRATAEVFKFDLKRLPMELWERLKQQSERYWRSRLDSGFLRAVLDHGERPAFSLFVADGVLNFDLELSPGSAERFFDPDFPAVFNSRSDAIYLDQAGAKQLQLELRSLFERYSALEGSKRYVLHLGLAPLEEG